MSRPSNGGWNLICQHLDIDSQLTFIEAQLTPHRPHMRQVRLVINFLTSPNSCSLSLVSQHKILGHVTWLFLSMHKHSAATETLKIKNDLDKVSVLHYPDIQWFFHCFTSVELILCNFFFFFCPLSSGFWTNAEGNQDKNLIFVITVGSVCMLTAVVTDHWAVLSPRVGERKHNMWGSPLWPLETL